MNYYILNFNSIDVSFFRDAKNFKNFVGNVQETLLPPNKRTFVGAFRNLLARKYAEKKNIDINEIWIALKENKNNFADFFNWWGDVNCFGNKEKSSIHGLFINDYTNFELSNLYIPLPAYVIKNESKFFNAVKNNNSINSGKQIENSWIKISNLKSLQDIKHISDFYHLENRLGIEIDKETRGSKDSAMFECQFVRPKNDQTSFSLILITQDKDFIAAIESFDLLNNENIVQVGGENKFFRLKITSFENSLSNLSNGKEEYHLFLEPTTNEIIKKFENYDTYSYQGILLGGYDVLNNKQKLANYYYAPGLSFVDNKKKKYSPNKNLKIVNNTLTLTF